MCFAHTLIICPEKIKYSGDGMWEWITKYKIDFLMTTPSTASMWGDPPKGQEYPNTFELGGEKLPLILVRKLEDFCVVLNG